MKTALESCKSSYLLLLHDVFRSDCVHGNSRRSSGDWKESSPASSAPGAKVRSLLPGIGRPRSKTDLTAAVSPASGGGRPISVQPRSHRCSYSVQSETASDSLVEPDSEGRRSRGFVTTICCFGKWYQIV